MPLLVQTALLRSQSVVAGSVMTTTPSPTGSTVISHRLLPLAKVSDHHGSVTRWQNLMTVG